MIICCGEALIDMVPRQLADGSGVFLPVPGGAIFNTAISLGRLGEEAGMLTSVSSDMFGDQLIEALQASKVNTDYCVRSKQPTTLAFVKLTNGHAQYSFFDENSAGRNLQAGSLPTLPASVEALHFGAISLIPEPCGTAYETLMANNQDKVLSLDPNIRPGFIEDDEKHRGRINRMITMSDIVKVSDEDLDWIAESGSQEKTIASWLDGTTKIVLITKGSEGVTAITSNGETHVAAQPIEVVDTIGAGDTFNAGFLTGLKRQSVLQKDALQTITDEQLSSALDLATKVAAVTCSRTGANPPWSHEL